MRRLLFRLLILSLIVGPVAFVFAALERASVLPATATLDPRMAVQARGLAVRLRDALDGPAEVDGTVRIVATESELNSALATAGRLVRPLRGQTQIDPAGVRIALSGQVPGLPDLGWINVTAQAAPSETGLEIVSVRLGRMDLPPRLTVSALRTLLDLGSADNAGSLMLGAVAGLATTPGRAELILATGSGGGPSMFEQVTGALRGLAGVGDAALASRHYIAMQDAAVRGVLPSGGSALPWVRFALAEVAAAGHATPRAAQDDLRAAFTALGAHCGDRRATEAIAGRLEGSADPSACAGTTLGGRRDLRQHFTLSAALAATGGGGMSFGMGEVKELLDAGRSGGSGYSFDDLAFDRAGIRLFETAMATAPADLSSLVDSISAEAAISPSIDGLPAGLSEADFIARFGTVDSAAYLTMLAEIDARIDALTAHGGG